MGSEPQFEGFSVKPEGNNSLSELQAGGRGVEGGVGWSVWFVTNAKAASEVPNPADCACLRGCASQVWPDKELWRTSDEP